MVTVFRLHMREFTLSTIKYKGGNKYIRNLHEAKGQKYDCPLGKK